MTEHKKKSRVVHLPGYAWIIWGLGASFFLVEYFIRMAPGVMESELMHAYRIDALGFGALSAYFYYAYLPMQVPVGALVDRFGAHRLLIVMCALCGISSFAFAASDVLWIAKASRFLTGFSSAFAFVGTLKLAQLWFPANRFGLLAGSTQALGMLGAAIGAGPVSALEAELGWRSTVMLMGAVVLVIALLFALLAREHPEKSVVEGSRSDSMSAVWQGLKVVLANPQTWANAVFAGLIYSPTAAFAELWGPTYLTHVRGFSHVVSASAVSMIFLGWAIGGPLNGYLSDWMGRRKPSLYWSAALSFFFLSMALYGPAMSPFWLFVLLFLFGMANTGLVNSYAISGEINASSISGVSMAFCNMASVMIGAMFQPLMGWALNAQWQGQWHAGIKVYSAQAYKVAALGLPLCLFASFLAVFFIRETYCRNVTEQAG